MGTAGIPELLRSSSCVKGWEYRYMNSLMTIPSEPENKKIYNIRHHSFQSGRAAHLYRDYILLYVHKSVVNAMIRRRPCRLTMLLCNEQLPMSFSRVVKHPRMPLQTSHRINRRRSDNWGSLPMDAFPYLTFHDDQ